MITNTIIERNARIAELEKENKRLEVENFVLLRTYEKDNDKIDLLEEENEKLKKEIEKLKGGEK